MGSKEPPLCADLVRASVIVPVYNVEAYVGDCLASLLAQDVDGLEVVVVNDGSTDSSREVVGAIAAADHRVRIIDKPNSGYGASLNRGLAEARGTYVGILESDDEMVDGALPLLLQTADAMGADVVKGDYILWWPTDETRTRQAHEVTADLCGALVDTRTDMRAYSIRSTIWSALYRREHLERHAIRFLETPGASYQDTSFNFKAFATSGRTAFVEAPIVRYRQDNAASSIHSKGKADAVGVEFDEIDRWLDDNAHMVGHDALVRQSLVERYNAYLWNLDRLDDEVGLAFLRDAGQQFAQLERSGRLDVATWDSWRVRNLRALQDDPARYLRLRKKYRGDSAASKARFALALGGPAALASALAERAGRR
jgi:glycosyltransferase involved in cell wall biosynthesis